MKKFVLIFFISVFLLSLFNTKQFVNAETIDYCVDGGRVVIDFEDQSYKEHFDFYTEFGPLPDVIDGKLYCWTLAEQKMIFKNYTYQDVEVNVDMSTINNCGKIEGGIYVQASNANNGMDCITAWCVSVEHTANSNNFSLKLHRFENNRWDGAKVDITRIPYTSNSIHLKVVIKNGTLYAFLNDVKKPYFSYSIGDGIGSVGLRSFYAPNIMDNFTVTGIIHEPNKDKLEKLILEAKNKIKLEDSICLAENLKSVLALAETANTQTEIDNAEKMLTLALEKSIKKYSINELENLINKSSKFLSDEKKYTANSYNALILVRNLIFTIIFI